MRSYGQYCGLAKALDVIGDRWSLLIVRELLLREACRYTDLRDGLPGIATNLLASRLRDLEQTGVIERYDAPPPVATTLFRLTERGNELRPAVHALGRWGVPLLEEAPDEDAFRSHWLALPLEIRLGGRAPQGPVRIEIRSGDEPFVVETVDGAVATRPGPAEDPDLVLSGPPPLILGVLMGRVGIADARARGLQCEGDPGAVRLLQPQPVG